MSRELTPEDLKMLKRLIELKYERFLRERLRERRAQAHRDQMSAKTVINKAFENGLVSGDTLRNFKAVKRLMKPHANARKRILSPEEFERLLPHLPALTREIVIMGYYTGMREGEILPLTWDKVDLKNREIRLEPEDTKDKEARTIPILEPLYDLLKAMPRPIHHNYVFAFNGKPMHDITEGLKRACREAEISYGRFTKGGFIFHDLRHNADSRIMPTSYSECLRFLAERCFVSA